jgi:hypothetical protein
LSYMVPGGLLLISPTAIALPTYVISASSSKLRVVI